MKGWRMGFAIEIIKGFNRFEAIVEDGESILAAIQRESIPLNAPCGGRGTCKKCHVIVSHQGVRQPKLACLPSLQKGW